MPHPLGVFIAFSFVITLGATLFWMLRLPRSLPQEAARAVYSVSATRSIVVPIGELFQTGRAVELASRLGRNQGATLVLAYIVEVPMVLGLDAPLRPEVEEQAREGLAQAGRIAQRHGVTAISSIVPSRTIEGGVRRVVQAYNSDVVVLGVQSTHRKVTSALMRAADALLRQLPCEVIVDSVPE
jgi:nucleotide-binding universal stress UspA family protein